MALSVSPGWTVYVVGAAADDDKVEDPDELEDAEGVGLEFTTSCDSSGCLAESVSMACSLRMRRSLISFRIVLFWSSRERWDMSEPPGVREGDFSFILAGTGVAADVLSLSREVDVDAGSSMIAGMVIVVLIVVVLEVVVESHLPPLYVLVEVMTWVAGTVASCSRLAVLADPAMLVAGTPGAGTTSV